jgi:hypothetical protein
MERIVARDLERYRLPMRVNAHNILAIEPLVIVVLPASARNPQKALADLKVRRYEPR